MSTDHAHARSFLGEVLKAKSRPELLQQLAPKLENSPEVLRDGWHVSGDIGKLAASEFPNLKRYVAVAALAGLECGK